MKKQMFNITAFTAAMLLLPSILFAWSTPYNISKNDTAIVSYTTPSIAVDSNGIAHVVWESWRSDNYWGPHWIIYATGYDTIWATPTWLSGDTPLVSSVGPEVAIDANGHPIVGWGQEGTYSIMYNSYNGSAWSGPQRIGFGICGLSMARDKYGYVHAVWTVVPDSGGLRYSKWNGSTWSSPMPIEPDSGIDLSWADIAVDSGGTLHVMAMDYRTSLGSPLAYFTYNGVAWQKMPNPPDTSTGQSCDPEITVGPDTVLHIVWEERAPYPRKREGWYCNIKYGTWAPLIRILPETLHISEPVIIYNGKKDIIAWDLYNIEGLGIYWCYRDSFGNLSTNKAITNSTGSYRVKLAAGYNKTHAAWANAGWIEYSWDSLETMGIAVANNHETIETKLVLQCYPNPSGNSITVKFSSSISQGVTLKVFNITGALVKTVILSPRIGDNRVLLKVNDLSNGIYILCVEQGKKKSNVQKMIILK